jgi:hypothetical protein
LLKTLAVIIGFQIVWLCCALGISNDIGTLPILSSLVYVGIVFFIDKNKKSFVIFMILSTILGFLIDTALMQSGWIVFKTPNTEPFEIVQPWWMGFLWLAFAASFPISFHWLKNKYLLASLLGAIFGPISYFSGAKLGAISSINHLGLIFVGLLWCITMPVMLRLSLHFVNFD